MNNKKITGSGLIFPIQLYDGAAIAQSGIELIRSCIKNILAFEPGSKYFQRDFGVPLRSLLSEPNDSYIEAILDFKLQTQLPLWDKRIIVEDVIVSRDREKLSARVIVKLTGTDPEQIIDLVQPLNSIR